jgi:undecaprenyl phosphate N,N'-diacetylbacillosamine 1-phosphate transferase
MYRFILKPFFDCLFAFISLVVTFPILITVMIVLCLSNKGTPFFIQSRPGKNEKTFHLLKFKTMNDKRDSEGNLLSDEIRITKIGNFIRKTSLDELPQLLNVLKGDMSLVGPRPLLVQYLPLYNMHQKRRHEVKPGITGLAQINGRNAISWSQKFDYDICYIETISFALDVKIVYSTILKVFKSEGISQEGQATMEFFIGNNEQ